MSFFYRAKRVPLITERIKGTIYFLEYLKFTIHYQLSTINYQLSTAFLKRLFTSSQFTTLKKAAM